LEPNRMVFRAWGGPKTISKINGLFA